MSNLSKIASSLISMLQTTNDEALRSQATENKKNQVILAGAGGASGSGVGDAIDKNIENLSTIANLSKSKKSKLSKPKKSELLKLY